MALICVLICLGIQRFLKFSSDAYNKDWAKAYYHWLTSKTSSITAGGLAGAAILLLPLVIAVGLVFSIVSIFLGSVGYYLLSIIWLWYCVDGRDFNQSPLANGNAKDLFLHSYQYLFAVIFWFMLLGPVGLALYIATLKLHTVMASDKDSQSQNCLKFTNKILGVLDWVPLRLLGLSFAMVGHFGAVFKLWLNELLHGIKETQQQAVEWGLAALKSTPGQGTTTTAKNNNTEVITLIDRSLLIWLVVLALLTIGYMVG